MWCELSIRSSLSDLSLCLLRFSFSLPFVSCQCLSTPFVLLNRCVSICFPFECLSLCPPLPKSLLYTRIKEDVSLRHHCSSNSCLRISSSFSLCMCPPCSLSPSTWSWKQFVNSLWPKIFFFLRDLASLIDVFLHIFQLSLKVCGAVCGVACHRYYRNNRQAICATFARARKLTGKSRRFAV